MILDTGLSKEETVEVRRIVKEFHEDVKHDIQGVRNELQQVVANFEDRLDDIETFHSKRKKEFDDFAEESRNNYMELKLSINESLSDIKECIVDNKHDWERKLMRMEFNNNWRNKIIIFFSGAIPIAIAILIEILG
jgi:hypothetical protein